MKHILIFLFLVAGVLLKAPGQGFYDINSIQVIEIVFPQSNWDHLLDSLVEAGDEGRLTGTVYINGLQFDSAGVRYKGNSSYNPGRVKNPLNIKLDYFIGDQTIQGYGTLKLSNGFKDPSFIRETMSYEIARNYFPASLSNYVKVTINGQYIGLYTNNQDADRFFMNTWFANGDNARFKGEINGNLPPGQSGVWKYFGTDSISYFPVYSIESDFGWYDLIRFLDTLNNYTSLVETVLDVDRHLWFLAFENLMVNLDSPINNPQNYYLCKDDNGRFNPVPWDLNETFGCFNNLTGSGPLNLIQLQQLDPFVHVSDVNFPILNEILNTPHYRRMYVAHMKTMLMENFSNGWYEERALEIREIIDEEVLADPNKLYTYDDFLNNLYYTVGGGPPPGNMPLPGITELMESRIDFLMNHFMFQAQSPVITDVGFSPATVTPDILVWFNARVTNATIVQLGYCRSQNGRFQKIPMFDDGNHHDGGTGDGIYGASLVAGTTGIRYYIFADNGNAASFSPVRAEFEYYSVPVTLDLVINEFMADNVASVKDQDGEYDDWIEIYNNTPASISLNGFHLTDKPGVPDKWTFPDTAVAGGGYLVVWCDEDGAQTGLHSNFKLSSSGEDIVLTDPMMNTIDGLSFAFQMPDTTTGRYPNGTGPFLMMWPTFSAENVNGFPMAVDDPGIGSRMVLGQNYPNPFNAVTTIPLYLDESMEVTLEICDIHNRPIREIYKGSLAAGHHLFQWEANEASPGIYICRLTTPDNKYQRKILIL